MEPPEPGGRSTSSSTGSTEAGGSPASPGRSVGPIDPGEALERLVSRYGVTDARDAAEEVLHDAGAGREQVLDALAVLRLARDHLDHLEAGLLRTAHQGHGTSWRQLAPALGVQTRQAAEQRYRRRVDNARGRDLSASRAALRTA